MEVRPVETAGVLHNPWMGWGLWAGPVSQHGRRYTVEDSTTGFGDDAPLFDWFCLDWMWADLEPEEGTYYWDELDQVMGYWAERGKQINLRVWVTDDPGWAGDSGADEVCPNWVWKAGAAYHEYGDEGGRTIKEPDYAHPTYKSAYLPRLRRFLEALAQRYDKPDNPFNLMGCMGYGQWGEWHTMWSDYVWPSKEVKHEILAAIVEMYADIFQHCQLSISYANDTFHYGSQQHQSLSNLGPGVLDDHFLRRLAAEDPEDKKYRQALDVALSRGFALARHGFIDGLSRTDRVIMEQEWQQRPMYAEANYSYASVNREGTHGTVAENLDVMCEWHSNYGHFYMDCEAYRSLVPEDILSFEQGLQAGGLGYRLVLTQATYPDTIAAGQLLLLRQSWENRNCGRLYRPHWLRLYLIGSEGRQRWSGVDWSFDATKWVKGKSCHVISVFQLAKDIEPGEYEVRIALVDSSGRPRIRLAVDGGDAELRYRLGEIRIAERQSASYSAGAERTC